MTRAERQQMREYFSARRAEERDFARGVALACRARGLVAERDAQTRPEWTGKREEAGTEMAETKSNGEGQGGAPAKALPRLRCPNCRTLIDTLEYGQYTWNYQHYTTKDDDWGTSNYSYVGDVVLTVKCGHCDADITQYVLHREQRLGALDTTPTNFHHDVQLPRGLTYNRSSARLTNAALAAMIADTRRLLCNLLDEEAEREYLGIGSGERGGPEVRRG